MEHSKHLVKVSEIQKVTMLKQEVAYSDFDGQIRKMYHATKMYQPWQIIICYDDVKISLEEAGQKNKLMELRAVCAVGSCIVAGIEYPDTDAILDLYQLGCNKPSEILHGRGHIFSKGSKPTIGVRRTSDLMIQLLK